MVLFFLESLSADYTINSLDNESNLMLSVKPFHEKETLHPNLSLIIYEDPYCAILRIGKIFISEYYFSSFSLEERYSNFDVSFNYHNYYNLLQLI